MDDRMGKLKTLTEKLRAQVLNIAMDDREAELTANFLAQLDSFTDKLRTLEPKVSIDAVRRQIGEDYAQWLDGLPDDEALEHLRSVDDSRASGAYAILSERLEPLVLAEICLEYLRRSGSEVRHTGAIRIGPCLKRTCDKEASHALALMICNQDEENDIRWAAYTSLILIQPDKYMELAGTEVDDPSDPDVLLDVDRRFIHAFL